MKRDPRKVAIMISVSVSGVMLAGKLFVYALTSSRVMLADAAESVVHGVATGFAAFSLWYSQRPADQCHPYGHGRIVYFSTGFEGALIFAAAMAVIYSGIEGLIHGVHPHRLDVGIAIASSLAAINLVLGIALVRIGRKHHAMVLEANGRHVLSDFWTTAGAIIGLTLVELTSISWIDPVAAILLGAWIMIGGASLLRRSYTGLMDQVPSEVSERLRTGLRQEVDGGLIVDFHQLRSRRVNDEIWIDVHVLVPGEVTLARAHEQVTEVEKSIYALFPDDKVHIASHIEPSDHESAHPGGHPANDVTV